MRCLALAQAWQDVGGKAVFAMSVRAPALEHRLAVEGIEVVRLNTVCGSDDDAVQTSALASEREASFVVADGYHFGAHYQRRIKSEGLQLTLLDDYGHAEHYFADFVVNQNLGAHAELYQNREPYTRLLVGIQYVLLRQQFLNYRDWLRPIPDVAHNVLVTLGGGDPNNVTSNVIKALATMDVKVKVVVGSSNPHGANLKSEIGQLRNQPELITNASNMPDLMAWADIAISAGGSTCWELAFIGLPSLVLILADNQRPVAEALNSVAAACKTTLEDVANDLDALLIDSDRRRSMNRRGRELVDGGGAQRLVSQMSDVSLHLRRAREDDSKLLWEWANEPEVRLLSFSTGSVSWASHVKWFERKLNDPHCRIFIGEDVGDTPCGQVRFDWNEAGAAEVDVSLDKRKRGSGMGTKLLDAAAKKIFQESPVRMIHAYVKLENAKSLRAFEKAGFKKLGLDAVRGHRAVHFIRDRNE